MTKILVVDDIPDNVKLLENDLLDDGYEVVVAYDGIQALSIANSEQPDVILMDINMPNLNGIDSCRQLKKDPSLAPIPIILVSARNQENDIVDGLDAGALDYITKPYNWNIVSARVRSASRIKSARDTIGQMNKKLSILCQTAHQFVDNVSHEFRTPLTVIKEFSSIIRDGLIGQINEEQCQYLDTVMDRVDDLTLMVNDMLDISRLESGQLPIRRKPCTAVEIIDRIHKSLEHKAVTNHIELNIEIDPHLPSLYCDPEKIGRVIINLGVNAIKFSEEGGCIRIWVKMDKAAQTVTFGITDHGPGICQENLQCIFERFRQFGDTLRSSTKGFGLGLNIAKEIVHLSFGEMLVESELGRGSTFSFTLPTNNRPNLITQLCDRVATTILGDVTMSVIEIKETIDLEPSIVSDLDDLIRHTLTVNDLAFYTADRGWYIVSARSPEAGDLIGSQIIDAIKSTNRNRAGVGLPELSIEPLGCWTLPQQTEQFVTECSTFIAESEPTHV